MQIVNSWFNSLINLGPGNGQISSFHLHQYKNIMVKVQMRFACSCCD